MHRSLLICALLKLHVTICSIVVCCQSMIQEMAPESGEIKMLLGFKSNGCQALFLKQIEQSYLDVEE